MGEFFLITAREGTPSLGYKTGTQEIRLHSTFSPTREAQQFILARKDELSAAKVVLVYGLGMGYHLIELEKNLSPDAEVYILETNSEIVEYTSQYFSISEYEAKGFNFMVSDNLQEVKSFLINILDMYAPEDVLILVHQPSLKIIPEHCQSIKHLFEDWEVKRETIGRYTEMMELNFAENILKSSECHSLNPFYQRFKDIPVVIVSAGPSLNNNKHLLPELKGKALIISVGSIAKSLLQIGCVPDGMVITDPSPIVLRQVEGLSREIPLFFFPTVQPSVLAEHRGPKIIMLQHGLIRSEEIAKENSWPLLDTGGSVATTALELAIYFGGNPIIFVGQDLAYTGGQSHAGGSTSYQFIPKTGIRLVKGNNGNMLETGKNFSIYLKWIETKLSKYPHREFINATEGGACISGTKVMCLLDVVQKLQRTFPIETLFKEALVQGNGGSK